MKTLLFDLYKVFYFVFNKKRYADAKATAFGNFVNSGFVLLFLVFALVSISFLIEMIWGVKLQNIHKVEVLVIFLICEWLFYLLLFKAWGLESRNYCSPEYKPDRATITKVRTIVIINASVFLLMIILKTTIGKN